MSFIFEYNKRFRPCTFYLLHYQLALITCKVYVTKYCKVLARSMTWSVPGQKFQADPVNVFVRKCIYLRADNDHTARSFSCDFYDSVQATAVWPFTTSGTKWLIRNSGDESTPLKTKRKLHHCKFES